MKRQPDAKWLREMAREAAEEPVPEVDWERVERGVFDQIEQRGRPLRLTRPEPAWPRAAAIAAIAAGIALAVSWSGSDTAPTVNPVPRANPDLPASPAVTATVGSDLVAHDTALSVHHDGWAHIRLAAHSRMRVNQLGDRVALDLIHGRIDARVDKHSHEQVFTVDVDGMRVAVRGTVFSVERHGGAMDVGVTRGAVEVGSTAASDSRSWLLTAPANRNFPINSLAARDEHRGKSSPGAENEENRHEVRPESESAPPHAARPRRASAPDKGDSSDPRELAAPSLPEALDEDSAAAALARIAAAVEACARQEMPDGNDQVTIHVYTTIRIRVAPDGHVAYARFEPPLAPKAQSCASAEVRRARFPRARTESFLSLPLSL